MALRKSSVASIIITMSARMDAAERRLRAQGMQNYRYVFNYFSIVSRLVADNRTTGNNDRATRRPGTIRPRGCFGPPSRVTPDR